jgi:hypothetical protein
MKARGYVFWVSTIYVFLFLASPLSATETELLKLIPQDGKVAGWIRDGETYVATDEASLAGFIDGAAPFYIERGTVEVVFQDYANQDVYLTVEIYRMKNEESAKHLYAEITSENPETLQEVGTEGRFVSELVGAYLIEYWQKSLFIRLTITDKSSQSKEALLTFATIISEQIPQ